MLGCLCAFVSVTFDLFKKIPRDVAHWVGLVSLFGQMLVGYVLVTQAIQFLDPRDLFSR